MIDSACECECDTAGIDARFCSLSCTCCVCVCACSIVPPKFSKEIKHERRRGDEEGTKERKKQQPKERNYHKHENTIPNIYFFPCSIFTAAILRFSSRQLKVALIKTWFFVFLLTCLFRKKVHCGIDAPSIPLHFFHPLPLSPSLTLSLFQLLPHPSVPPILLSVYLSLFLSFFLSLCHRKSSSIDLRILSFFLPTMILVAAYRSFRMR